MKFLVKSVINTFIFMAILIIPVTLFITFFALSNIDLPLWNIGVRNILMHAGSLLIPALVLSYLIATLLVVALVDKIRVKSIILLHVPSIILALVIGAGLYTSRGEQVPEDWIIDSEGNPSTDPNNFTGILPLGGSQGYKGYGLSFMIEIFAGILTGIGYGIDPSGRHNDGCLLIALKVDAFRPLEDFKREVDDFIRQIKHTPTAPGFDEILYPGEIEWRTAKQRSKDGIYIEDATWTQIQNLMKDFSVTIELE